MDRSSMSFAKSGSEGQALRAGLLDARDRRQELLDQYLGSGCPTVVFLSLALPGEEKNPPGASALATWTVRALVRKFPELINLNRGSDCLGIYAIMQVPFAAPEAKRRCVAIETAEPFSRLIDLDVYDRGGMQTDRRSLGLAPRPCLVCDRPAVECIRLRRHTTAEVKGRVDELLAHFRD